MTITTRVGAVQQVGLGKSQSISILTAQAGAGTNGAAGSGFQLFGIGANAIGTTYPTTLANPYLVQAPANRFRSVLASVSDSTRSGWLGIFYKIGTLALTGLLGNEFTHDGATFPVTRTNLWGTAQPIPLWPIIYLTTASSTTPPAFIIKDSGGGTGYVNQAGANVVGTKTFTLPAAATAVQSAYMLRMEDGDSAVQDIVQIDLTTATSTGAATIYGFEPITPLQTALSLNAVTDGLLGYLDLHDLTPAVATTGTATSFIGILSLSTANVSFVGQHISVRES